MRFARPAAAFALLSLLTAACSDGSSPTTTPERPRFIIGGSPTGDAAFTNVGALLLDRQNGRGPRLLCTGSLIAPTVFLTAAHCLAFVTSLPGNPKLFVSFEADVVPAPTGTVRFAAVVARQQAVGVHRSPAPAPWARSGGWRV